MHPLIHIITDNTLFQYHHVIRGITAILNPNEKKLKSRNKPLKFEERHCFTHVQSFNRRCLLPKQNATAAVDQWWSRTFPRDDGPNDHTCAMVKIDAVCVRERDWEVENKERDHESGWLLWELRKKYGFFFYTTGVGGFEPLTSRLLVNHYARWAMLTLKKKHFSYQKRTKPIFPSLQMSESKISFVPCYGNCGWREIIVYSPTKLVTSMLS